LLDLTPASYDQDTTTVSIRYGEQEGLSFSPGAPHSVVIFNKPREIRYKSKDKAWFGDIWRANGWDGEAPVTRIEARYKREALHELVLTKNTPLEHGIETLNDLFTRLDHMWQYSTQLWLRHCIPSQDQRKTAWPTSPWWQVVQGAVFEQEDAAPAQRQKVHAFHEQRIVSAILGYAESFAAWKGDELGQSSQSLYGTLAHLIQRAQRHYEERETNFQDEVRHKRKLIGFAS
jgi:hypothetical protein